jgi:hypothetical protein
MVADTCNPSYLEDGDQEDSVQGQPRQNVPGDPILKNSQHKKCWWSGLSGRAPA